MVVEGEAQGVVAWVAGGREGAWWRGAGGGWKIEEGGPSEMERGGLHQLPLGEKWRREQRWESGRAGVRRVALGEWRAGIGPQDGGRPYEL